MVITIAGAPAAHTITITNGTTNNIQIAGFEPYTAASPEISIRCCGSSSFTSANWISGTRLNSIWQLTTDLPMVCLGVNDAIGGVTPSVFSTNLATLKTNMRIQAASDIVYWTFPQIADSAAPAATQLSIVDAMIAQAASDIPVLDLYRRSLNRGGYATLGTSASGWYADTLHPSAFGNHDIAAALCGTILWSDI